MAEEKLRWVYIDTGEIYVESDEDEDFPDLDRMVASLPEPDDAVGSLIAAAPHLLEIAKSAPVISQYHGAKGFDVERFINDYAAWNEKRRAAVRDAEA